MHLVAVLTSDPTLSHSLTSFRDPGNRFLLHPVPPAEPAGIIDSLRQLDFAGAMVLDEAAQAEALRVAARRSLDAQEVGAADTITVTPSGPIGEYNFGRAVGSCLRSANWDGRNASVVLLGAGNALRGIARELSSLGVGSLTVLAASRPVAEQALPTLAATTQTVARAAGDPLAETFLRNADLVVRVGADLEVPEEALGPHLALVDLVPEEVSGLRRAAINYGASTFNLKDVQAHLIALGLSHILGGPIPPEALLSQLHQA